MKGHVNIVNLKPKRRGFGSGAISSEKKGFKDESIKAEIRALRA